MVYYMGQFVSFEDFQRMLVLSRMAEQKQESKR